MVELSTMLGQSSCSGVHGVLIYNPSVPSRTKGATLVQNHGHNGSVKKAIITEQDCPSILLTRDKGVVGRQSSFQSWTAALEMPKISLTGQRKRHGFIRSGDESAGCLGTCRVKSERVEVQNQELELKALYQHGDSEQVCEMRLFHHVDCGGKRNDSSGEDGLPER